MGSKARLLFAALAGLSATACASTAKPDQPANACSVFRQHDSWWRAAKRAEDRWGAPPDLVLAIIRQESGFDHDARPARRKFLFFFPGPRPSSAHGYAQALDSTWAEYERAAGDRGLDRDEFRDAADFVSWYVAGSRRELGLSYSDARGHYLAYHEGRGGYRRGTYRGKAWLVTVAARVQSYRDAYSAQLAVCADDLDRWWFIP